MLFRGNVRTVAHKFSHVGPYRILKQLYWYTNSPKTTNVRTHIQINASNTRVSTNVQKFELMSVEFLIYPGLCQDTDIECDQTQQIPIKTMIDLSRDDFSRDREMKSQS